jgi:hypothetical protein
MTLTQALALCKKWICDKCPCAGDCKRCPWPAEVAIKKVKEVVE